MSIGEVEAPRGLCNLGEARYIELGIHRIAVFIANKVIATLIRPDRDQRSGGGTKADRENPNPGSFRLFGGIKSALLQILSIGHEHQGTGRPLTLAEGGYRHSDRRGNVGSSFGDRVGIQITDRGQDSTFVHRERGLKESRSGKGDEPDAISTEQIKEILRDQLGATKTGGRRIGRKHAARNVDGQNHVPPLGRDGLLAVTITRLGQRHDR